MELSDATLAILLRLGVAVLAGGLVGLDRELHRKPVGLRTTALVTLAAAMVTLAICGDDPRSAPLSADVSRVVQGILTGVGFLGAGVILRDQAGHVTGLTTATTIWVAAALGVLCGLGKWTLVVVALVLVLLLLTVGRRLDHMVQRLSLPDRLPPDEPAARPGSDHQSVSR